MEVAKARPSYVRFEKRAVEDRQASLANGYYTTRDEVFAVVTPHGSTDEIPRVATEWLSYLDRQAEEGRIPHEWVAMYRAAYDKYMKGEEIPLNGAPIKGWTVASPAQQQNLIAANILTVEDLAAINESGLARVGMEAHSLKQKAIAWLEAANGPGKAAQRLSALETQVAQLIEQNAAQQEVIRKLRAESNAKETA